MGKFVLIVAILLLGGLGLWLFRLSGPQQLDLADRLWPGSEPAGKVEYGIAYGDDPRQRYDRYHPAALTGDCEGKSFPTLIFFHGGSWRDGDRQSYGFVGRAFAARGFHVVVADYRKVPTSKFPTFVEDAAKAIAHAHRNPAPCTAPARLYVMGHSAGAHIAMLAALDRKWLAVEGLEPTIIAGVIGLAGPYDFYPFTSEAAEAALGQWPRPEETQPISYASADAPPLLLLSGEADTTVKPRNSHRLAARIEEAGGKASKKLYPGIGHSGIVMAIAKPFRSKARVIQDIAQFAGQHGS